MSESATTNRNPTIFLVHTKVDGPIVADITRYLQDIPLQARVDIQEVPLNDNIVHFIAQSMNESDYCVILWSTSVNLTPFIREEISVAYVRLVKERKIFLIIAQLDDSPIPSLFESRVFVRLFPNMRLGLDDLASIIQHDAEVHFLTQKPIVPSLKLLPNEKDSIEVYICSGVFDRTLVWRVIPSQRGSDLLAEVIGMLGVPSNISHEGRVGVRLNYHLRGPQGRLHLENSLADQDVVQQSVLWLEVELEIFAAGVLVENLKSTRVYRDTSPPQQQISERKKQEVLEFAAEELSNSLFKAGARHDSVLRYENLKSRLLNP